MTDTLTRDYRACEHLCTFAGNLLTNMKFASVLETVESCDLLETVARVALDEAHKPERSNPGHPGSPPAMALRLLGQINQEALLQEAESLEGHSGEPSEETQLLTAGATRILQKISSLSPWTKAVLHLGRSGEWQRAPATFAFDYVFYTRSLGFMLSTREYYHKLQKDKKMLKELSGVCKKLKGRKSWGGDRNMHGNAIGPQIVESAEMLMNVLEGMKRGMPFEDHKEVRRQINEAYKASKKGSKKVAKVMARSCGGCGKEEKELPSDAKLTACGRCRIALYCSKECQTADWKRGHKHACAPMK